jgi:hypothetical protein
LLNLPKNQNQISYQLISITSVDAAAAASARSMSFSATA